MLAIQEVNHVVRPLYRELSATIQAYKNCLAANPQNTEWAKKHRETLMRLVDLLPYGSGIESLEVDFEKSHLEKIIVYLSFHHMNADGFYCGYTDHTITITPSFHDGVNLRISGSNRQDIKEYLH